MLILKLIKNNNLEQEVENALSIYKNSKVPHIDTDFKYFLKLRNELKQTKKYLKS